MKSQPGGGAAGGAGSGGATAAGGAGKQQPMKATDRVSKYIIGVAFTYQSVEFKYLDCVLASE